MDRAEENRILSAAQVRLEAKRKALGIEPLRRLSFFVPGKPASKGSPAILRNRRTGKPFVREKPSEVSWEQTIAMVALAARRRAIFAPLAGPVAVALEFTLPMGKGASDPLLRASMKPHPDLDKLARAVLDAITQVLIADDCQVTELVARKFVGDRPGVQITIQRHEAAGEGS